MRIIFFIVSLLISLVGSLLSGQSGLPFGQGQAAGIPQLSPESANQPGNLPDLAECLLTPQDFEPISGVYTRPPVYEYITDFSPTAVAVMKGHYPTSVANNYIGFIIAIYDNPDSATNEYNTALLPSRETVTILHPLNVSQLPDPHLYILNEDGMIILLMQSGRIIVSFLTREITTFTHQEAMELFDHIGKQQMEHLINCGY